MMMGPSCPGEVSEVSKIRYRKLGKEWVERRAGRESEHGEKAGPVRRSL